MFALLIIPILVSGYIVCSYHPKHYYRLHRTEGQLLYLKVIATGFFCILFSFFISVSIYMLCTKYMETLPPVYAITHRFFLFFSTMKSDCNFVHMKWLSYIAINSIVLSFLYSLVGKWIYREKGDHLLSLFFSIVQDSSLDSLFFWSMVEQELLLLTLDSGKVYAGIITNMGEPNEQNGPNQEFSIYPLMSGYRKSDTKEVIFTNAYASENFEAYDIDIVIPQRQVVSASKFDPFIYEKLTRKNTDPPPPPPPAETMVVPL